MLSVGADAFLDVDPHLTRSHPFGPEIDVCKIDGFPTDLEDTGDVPKVFLRPAFDELLHLLENRVLG